MILAWKLQNLQDGHIFKKVALYRFVHFLREGDPPNNGQPFSPMRNMYNLICKYGIKDDLLSIMYHPGRISYWQWKTKVATAVEVLRRVHT